MSDDDIRMARHVEETDAAVPEPEGPPERVPVDVDAGVAVAEVLGLIDIGNHAQAVADALDIHAQRTPEADARARVYFRREMRHATGEDWAIIVQVAELVGRRREEERAP